MLPPDLHFSFKEYFDENGMARPGRFLRIEGHTHTDFTDGMDPAEQSVKQALALGLDTLVFAEHMRRGAPWVEGYFKDVFRLAEKYSARIRIICGIEARVVDHEGTLDVDPDMAERTQLVVGSVHGIPRDPDSPEAVFHVPGRRETLESEHAMLMGLIRNPAVDVLGHPFGTYFEKYGFPPEDVFHDVLRAAARANKVVEINARHTDTARFLECAAAADMDFLFWPGSDAHLARHVGRVLQTLFPAFTTRSPLENS